MIMMAESTTMVVINSLYFLSVFSMNQLCATKVQYKVQNVNEISEEISFHIGFVPKSKTATFVDQIMQS